MQLCELVLRESSIATAELDRLFRTTITNSLWIFCGNLGTISEIQISADMSDAFYEWRDSLSRDDRTTMVANFLETLSTDIRYTLKRYIGDVMAKYPPRLRRTRYPFVDISPSDDYRGHYSTDSEKIQVYVKNEEVEYALFDSMTAMLFGHDDGEVEKFINGLVPVLIHEYVHYEQWARGLKGNVTHGYITHGAYLPNKLKGDHFDNVNNAMRYYSSAHEIEAYAAGAASQIIQSLHVPMRDKNKPVDLDRLCEITQDLSMALTNVGQLSAYSAMREYRDHYIEKGFRGEELEVVFKRFMKILYLKLIRYGKERMGKNETERSYPDSWKRYARDGYAKAIGEIAYDIAFKKIDGENIDDLVTDAASFLQTYFHNDKWDYDLGDKITKVLSKLIQKEIDAISKN